MTSGLAAVGHELEFLTGELERRDHVYWNGMMTFGMLYENVKIDWDWCCECDGSCDYYGCFGCIAQAE